MLITVRCLFGEHVTSKYGVQSTQTNGYFYGIWGDITRNQHG